MKTVKDTTGREWRFAITFGLVERWKEESICDLFDKPLEFQPDVLQVIQLFYNESTTSTEKPSEREFKNAMDEGVIKAIESAWRSELENFIHALNPMAGEGIREINRTIDEGKQEAGLAARRLVQGSGIAETLKQQLSETEEKAASAIKEAITSGHSESPEKPE